MFGTHGRRRPNPEHRNGTGPGNFTRAWGEGIPFGDREHSRPEDFDDRFDRTLQPWFSPGGPVGKGTGRRGPEGRGPDAMASGETDPGVRRHEQLLLPPQDPAKDAMRKDSLDLALNYLSRAEKLSRAGAESTLLRALILREQAQLVTAADGNSMQIMDDAISYLQSLVNRFPRTAEYQLQLARTLMQAVQLEPSEDLSSLISDESYLGRAVEMLRSLHSSQPQIPEYAATLAQVSELLGLVSKELADRDLPEKRGARITLAEDLLRNAVDLQIKRCEREPTDIAEQLWLARYEISLALIVAGRSEPRETKESLNKIRDRLEPLNDNDEFGEIIASMRARIDRVEMNPPPPRRQPERNGPGGRPRTF